MVDLIIIQKKNLKNKPLILYQNNIYDFQSNNRYNISIKIIQLKQRNPEESIEITMPNKDNNINDEYFDSNNIKGSICDEMASQNFGIVNSLIRSTTNDYINKLGFKNNVLWSENFYKKNNLFSDAIRIPRSLFLFFYSLSKTLIRILSENTLINLNQISKN